VWHFVTGREGGGKKCWKKRDIINEWPQSGPGSVHNLEGSGEITHSPNFFIGNTNLQILYAKFFITFDSRAALGSAGHIAESSNYVPWSTLPRRAWVKYIKYTYISTRSTLTPHGSVASSKLAYIRQTPHILCVTCRRTSSWLLQTFTGFFSRATEWSPAFARIKSVCPSVRLSLSHVVQDIEICFAPYDREMSLVSRRLTFRPEFRGSPRTNALNRGIPDVTENLTTNPPYLRNGTEESYYHSHLGNCIRAFAGYWNRWPWMTFNGVATVILHYYTEFGSFGGQLRQSD